MGCKAIREGFLSFTVGVSSDVGSGSSSESESNEKSGDLWCGKVCRCFVAFAHWHSVSFVAVSIVMM